MVEENKKPKSQSFEMFMKEKTRNFFVNIFTYSTVRSATIQSLKVGVAYRFAQLVLLSYIIGFEPNRNNLFKKIIFSNLKCFIALF